MLRCIIILLAWLASAGSSFAAERAAFADLASAIRPIMGNLRSATSYTRTGNIALAQIETAEAMTAWGQLQQRLTGVAPAPYQAAAFDLFLAAGRDRLAAADRALNSGDNISASNELLTLRRSFHDLRRASGLYD